MPRTKSAPASLAPRRSPSSRKPVSRTIRPKKKTRSVLVDVIEDEPLNSDSAWLAEDDKLIARADEESAVKGEKGKENYFSEKTARSNNDDLDSQKQFFSGLAEEIKDKKTTSKAKENETKSSRRVVLYRRLVIKFVVLVGIIAAVVAYFSFSQLTVTLNLKGETINDNLLLKIVDANATSSSATAGNPDLTAAATSTSPASSTDSLLDQNDPRETIKGTIKEVAATVTKTYPANGESFLGNEIVGRVNIINNYNKDQALVATTRLLSPDNKIFRIKNSVLVPAGGEVAVDIYADKPTADMAIGPASFTIPGLWVGLQDKIYAKSDAAFTYNQQIQKYVNASDLAYAAQDINSALLTAAKAQADSTLTPGVNWLYITNDPATITIDAKAGDQKTQFNATAVGKIIAVSFPKDEVAKLAAAKLNLVIPDDKELIDFNPDNIIYNLDNYDPVAKVATVKATFTGTMALKSDSAEISPASLVNLTSDQIASYLTSQPEVSGYSLNFFPSFIKRAPSLVDRIKIEINKN